MDVILYSTKFVGADITTDMLVIFTYPFPVFPVFVPVVGVGIELFPDIVVADVSLPSYLDPPAPVSEF